MTKDKKTQVNIAIWEKLYKNGRSVLQYPDNILVTLTHNLTKPEVHRTVLDYGFGSGSNLIYLLKRGFLASGVEVSDSAMKIVSARLSKEKLSADLRLIKRGKIPYKNNTFNAVIAWQVLYYNDWQSLRLAVSEINRVLTPGGIFIGTMAAPGDISEKQAYYQGDSIYQSMVNGQEGARILIVKRNQLTMCFPRKKLNIGRFGYKYGENQGSHWIITYEK